ncbi:MAG: pilus assembly protein PilZ [Deltaproteobacteria bacterium]|nr:pilus assembly protein PilZ [Deltaproteobacteria bacterium]
MMADREKNRSDFVLLRANRRKNFRGHLIVLKVKGSSMNRSFFGYAKTISRNGMFIASISPKEVGEEFTLEFKPPTMDVPVTCLCTVIWRREYTADSPREPGMALKFIDLDDASREAIDKWAKNQARY